jgi:glycerol kinase
LVPALSGLACPHWDRSAGALWIGMSGATSKRDLAQALLEGIALQTAEVVRAMDARIAISGRISVDGGLTRSRYFTRFLANALQREVLCPDFDELTAFGCATLALEDGPIRPGRLQSFVPDVADAESWHARFAEALGRAKAWR